MAQEGFVSVASRHSAAETVERLLAALKKRDLAVFARIDHAAAAAAVGMPLRPTESGAVQQSEGRHGVDGGSAARRD
jgi:uncharacterized protein (DUF302 family)